jgi:hypothetical protein
MGRKYNLKDLPKNDNEKMKITLSIPAWIMREVITEATAKMRSVSNFLESILAERYGDKKEGN